MLKLDIFIQIQLRPLKSALMDKKSYDGWMEYMFKNLFQLHYNRTNRYLMINILKHVK